MIQQVAEFLFTKVQKKKRKKGRYIVMIIIGRKGKAMGEIVRKFEFRNGGVDRWIGVKKIKERERENRWYLTGNVTRCHKGTFPMDQGQNILTYDIHKWQVFHLVHVAVDRDRISFFFFFWMWTWYLDLSQNFTILLFIRRIIDKLTRPDFVRVENLECWGKKKEKKIARLVWKSFHASTKNLRYFPSLRRFVESCTVNSTKTFRNERVLHLRSFFLVTEISSTEERTEKFAKKNFAKIEQ